MVMWPIIISVYRIRFKLKYRKFTIYIGYIWEKKQNDNFDIIFGKSSSLK